MSQLELHKAAVAMVKHRGNFVMTKAMQKILNTTYDSGGVLDSALKHYAKANLPLVKPLFPTLMSLSYEAATGSTQKNGETDSVALAMLFIAFSADVHDDVVDCSDVKYGKRTVCGRFGSEVALLVGDVLLAQGYTLLHSACENLLPKQKQEISISLSKALIELSAAEALDSQLSKKTVIKPDKYLKTMHLKGVFAELQCRIGGIIGQADDEMLNTLTSFGRAIGMLGTIQDEFCDMFDASELKHRIKFECPPLPMIYALQDEKVKTVLKELVEQIDQSKTITNKIAEIVLTSTNVCNLKRKINKQINSQKHNWTLIEKSRVGHDMFLLLQAFSSLNY